MMTNDLKSLVPAQEEKLEWVTPKISLMESKLTDGKQRVEVERIKTFISGPS